MTASPSLLVAVAFAAAAAAWAVRPGSATRRAMSLRPGPPGADGAGRVVDRAPGDDGAAVEPAWPRRFAAVSAGLGAALVLGGPIGAVAGVVLGVGLGRVLRRLEPASVRRRRDRVAADLPVAADLLAAGVAAGARIDAAAGSVAAALGGPLGAALHEVATAVRLGADPAPAWAALGAGGTGGAAGARPDPGLAAFGRAVARALDSGAPLAPALQRIARDQRARARAAAELAARRVGVRAVAPLGLCFLPAFVLVGVVPVVVSVAGSVLGSLP